MGDMAMRRGEKEIEDREEIEEIIGRALVCRLGMVDAGKPYVVPLSFGYEEGSLYLHSASAGRKVEVLRQSPEICFEMDVDCEVARGEQACQWGMRFRSIIGFGRAEFLEDVAEKRKGLEVIMAHYAEAGERFAFADREVARTVVIRVEIESISGKKSGY
jgi:uncharacterized protein